VHNQTILINGNVRDTLAPYDTTYDPIKKSQILEFNGDNSYSVTDYSQASPVVTYGKYTFSGAAFGTIVMTPNITSNVIPVAISDTYLIMPSNSVSNSILVLISTTTLPGSVVSDSTFYTFF